MKRIIALVLALVMSLALVACGGTDDENTTTTNAPKATDEAKVDLSGEELMVFSGAGLSDPFQEIVDTFKKDTGCDVQVVYGPTGTLISQIQTSEEGDLLIAGAKDELDSMAEGEVTAVLELVKHIPVVAVQKGNPKGIKAVEDLDNDGVKLLIPNAETTPIGKIAAKALKEAGIYDNIDIAAITTTAPLAITALAQQEADAGIVWKENAAANDKVEILDLPEMEKYIKVVPAASLKYSVNEKAREAFLEYLESDEAMAIWAKYGYEQVAAE